MKYERPAKRDEGPKIFELGSHAATIKKVEKKTSKSGNQMFMLKLEGTQKEQGVFFLVFGNDYTAPNLNYILASIEDNGIEIPEIVYGHNKATFEFLENKEVYINVTDELNQGELKRTIKTFLTLDEFEKCDLIEDEQSQEESW